MKKPQTWPAQLPCKILGYRVPIAALLYMAETSHRVGGSEGGGRGKGTGTGDQGAGACVLAVLSAELWNHPLRKKKRKPFPPGGGGRLRESHAIG